MEKELETSGVDLEVTGTFLNDLREQLKPYHTPLMANETAF